MSSKKKGAGALFLLTKNDKSEKKERAFDEQKAGGKIPLRFRHSRLFNNSQ